MEIETFKDTMANIKKGTFTKATWQSEKVINGDTYTKTSKGVVRFVKYGHIKGVVVKGQTNTNENVDLDCEFLYHNTNTKSNLIQIATTKVKPHVTYYLNGNEIAKEQYEMAIPPKDNGGLVVFRIKVENLVSLG